MENVFCKCSIRKTVDLSALQWWCRISSCSHLLPGAVVSNLHFSMMVSCRCFALSLSFCRSHGMASSVSIDNGIIDISTTMSILQIPHGPQKTIIYCCSYQFADINRYVPGTMDIIFLLVDSSPRCHDAFSNWLLISKVSPRIRMHYLNLFHLLW